jgi:hypothetical protein
MTVLGLTISTETIWMARTTRSVRVTERREIDKFRMIVARSTLDNRLTRPIAIMARDGIVAAESTSYLDINISIAPWVKRTISTCAAMNMRQASRNRSKKVFAFVTAHKLMKVMALAHM